MSTHVTFRGVWISHLYFLKGYLYSLHCYREMWSLCPRKSTADTSWAWGGFGGLYGKACQAGLWVHEEQELCSLRQKRSHIASGCGWRFRRSSQPSSPSGLLMAFPSVMLRAQKSDVSVGRLTSFWIPSLLLTSWADYLTSWSIRYLICKMQIIIDSTTQDRC